MGLLALQPPRWYLVGGRVVLGLMIVGVTWGQSVSFPVHEDFKATLLFGCSALVIAGRIAANAVGPSLCALRLPVGVYALSLVAAAATTRPWLGECSHLAVRLASLAMFTWALCGLGADTLAFAGAVSAIACAATVVTSLVDVGVSQLWGDPPGFLSPIGYVTYVGATLALQVPWAMAWALRSQGLIGRAGWTVVTLLLLVGVRLSGARAAMVGLAAGGLVFLAWTARERLRPRVSMLGWILGAAALWTVSWMYLPRRHDLADRDARPTLAILMAGATDPSSLPEALNQASTGRWHIWRNTLSMIGDRPWLGRGSGRFRFDYPAYAHRNGEDPFSRWNRWLMHPHNEVLNQWVEVGSFGVLAALVAAGLVLGRASTGARHTDPGLRWLGVTSLVGLVTGMTCSQFDTGASVSTVRLMVALYVAGAVTAGEKRAAEPLRTSMRVAAAISLATLLCVEAAFDYAQWAALRSRTATSQIARMEWARRALAAAPMTLLTGRTYAAALESIRPGLGGPTYLDMAGRYRDVPLSLYSAARAELERGRPEAARTLLEQTVLRDPSMAEASQLLGLLRDGASAAAP